VAVVLSSFLFIKAIQVGDYAESVIRSKTGFIVIFWALVWLASFVYSMRTALQIAGRVAGPIRRMEHLMDEILNGKEVRINLRKEDALNGVAQRINQLLELQKHLAMKEPRNQ
jgi:hypothetical protein